MTQPTAFTVVRSRWLRGQGNILSRLLAAPDSPYAGEMCCLGFYALACGYEASDIEGLTSPEDLQNASGVEPLLNDGSNTELCQRLMDYNDDASIDDVDREAALTRGFASLGVEVTFVD